MVAIGIDNIRLRAFHGVDEQERIVGQDYVVSLTMDCDADLAVESDDVSHTVNYAEAYAVVKKEMAVPSMLLEHVAGRIAGAIMKTQPLVQAVKVKVVKVCPPMGAACDGAWVEVNRSRQK